MKIKSVKLYSVGTICAISLLLLYSCNSNNNIQQYKGTPFGDNIREAAAQEIPGKVQCEYFDFGGEGIAFHDSDSINSGSGGLNPADGSYLHEFRISESVDISYTKFQDPPMDNSEYNFVEPEKDQLYIGWTQPGEWLKYTVKVNVRGKYELGIMYTSNQSGSISVSFNDQDVSGVLQLPTTYVEADTLTWRQWHHWNYIDKLTEIELEEGVHTITLHTAEMGNMNYDYLNFRLAGK